MSDPFGTGNSGATVKEAEADSTKVKIQPIDTNAASKEAFNWGVEYAGALGGELEKLASKGQGSEEGTFAEAARNIPGVDGGPEMVSVDDLSGEAFDSPTDTDTPVDADTATSEEGVREQEGVSEDASADTLDGFLDTEGAIEKLVSDRRVLKAIGPVLDSRRDKGYNAGLEQGKAQREYELRLAEEFANVDEGRLDGAQQLLGKYRMQSGYHFVKGLEDMLAAEVSRFGLPDDAAAFEGKGYKGMADYIRGVIGAIETAVEEDVTKKVTNAKVKTQVEKERAIANDKRRGTLPKTPDALPTGKQTSAPSTGGAYDSYDDAVSDYLRTGDTKKFMEARRRFGVD